MAGIGTYRQSTLLGVCRSIVQRCLMYLSASQYWAAIFILDNSDWCRSKKWAVLIKTRKTILYIGAKYGNSTQIALDHDMTIDGCGLR